MCSRTLYNWELIIQFTCIPVEFVVCFIRYQNCVKVKLHFPWLLSYLLLISLYSWCLHGLRVQCLELYTGCILSWYHLDKVFHFQGKFHVFVKTVTESVRLKVVHLNLVLSTASGVMFCEIYLQSVVHITTIRNLFILFSSFFNQSSIPDPPSSILAPGFPVNLKVLLIKIVLLFDHWSNQYCSKVINAFFEFVDGPVPEKLDMYFLHEALQVECMIVKYKATPINISMTHT